MFTRTLDNRTFSRATVTDSLLTSNIRTLLLTVTTEVFTTHQSVCLFYMRVAGKKVVQLNKVVIRDRYAHVLQAVILNRLAYILFSVSA